MRRYYQEIRWYLKFVFRRYIAKSEWKMILNRTESIVVMSCGVYGNYDSAVRRWISTGSFAKVSRGDGALTLG